MGHREGDYQLGEVIAERGKGDLVEIDVDRPGPGEQDVARVGVLVEGGRLGQDAAEQPVGLVGSEQRAGHAVAQAAAQRRLSAVEEVGQ